MRQKNTLRNDYIEDNQSEHNKDLVQGGDVLVFHKSFNVDHNNDIATKQLRL